MIISESYQRFKRIIVAGTFCFTVMLVAAPGFAEEGLVDELLEEAINEEEEFEADLPEEEVIEPTFSDVAESDFAFHAIEYLVKQGLIEGSGDGKFHPKALIKRSEIAKILALDKGYKAPSSYVIKAKDITAKHWAYDYMAALEREKIFVGFEGLLRPNDPITNAELAVLLTRVYSYAQPARFHSFTDVKTNHWAYLSINRLATNGITAQAGAAFKPNEQVTRERFALFLARTLDDQFKPR